MGGDRGVREQPGWPLRVRGDLKARWAGRPWGWSGRRTGPPGVCWAGGLLLHRPRLLAPLLHISTFRASPPRMPNLAHAICRLSSEIGTRTKAECITSPQLPLHEERRRGRDRGPRDKRPTLNFLFHLPDHSSRLSQVLGASGSSQVGPRSRTRDPILGRSQGQGTRSDCVACPPG